MKTIKILLFLFIAFIFHSCQSLMEIAGALSTISDTTSSSSTSNNTSSYSNTTSYSSYNTNSSTTSKKTKVKVNCWACKGTGRSVSKTYPATYGVAANEIKREYCKYCEKYDKPHTHKICTACKGLGHTYEYK